MNQNPLPPENLERSLINRCAGNRSCIWSKTKRCVYVVTVSLMPMVAVGQASPALDVPESSGNDRFFSDIFVDQRPALTFNGFSCTDTGSCGNGLGVVESISLLVGNRASPVFRNYLDQLLDWAAKDLNSVPTARKQIIANTNVVQARMTIALLWIVMEANGMEPLQDFGAGPESASAALSDALNALYSPNAYRISSSLSDDAVKWAAPVTNLARAVDMYLAIENAALHFPSHVFSRRLPPLPSCTQKHAFLKSLADQIDELDDLGNIPVLLGIKRDEIQPGNWPMKVHVAAAYAALAMQSDGTESCDVVPDYNYEHLVERGMRSAGAPTARNRSKHWNYQTGSGNRFFAEGPYYFHLSLSEIIAFWHAVRLNSMLDAHPDFDLDDPFRSDWLTAPLNWLADIVAPGGSSLPLDDGNRVFMNHSNLLAWSSDYGNAQVGGKYAWIADQKPDSLSDNENLLALMMAIPRAPAAGSIAPEHLVGSVLDLYSIRSEEQIAIVRSADRSLIRERRDHFIAMNGEYGDSITRGEGHEQADQLQLLYYVGDQGILIDSGYDNATGVANSTWNHYFDHNVLTISDGSVTLDGGLPPPLPSLLATRIVSEHADADFLGVHSQGRVHALRGEVELFLPPPSGFQASAVYERISLFIDDDEEAYLIDINIGQALERPLDFKMLYHVEGELESRHEAMYTWRNAAFSDSENETHVAPVGWGSDLEGRLVSDTTMERFQRGIETTRLELSSSGPVTRFGVLSIISTGDPGRREMVPSIWTPKSNTASSTVRPDIISDPENPGVGAYFWLSGESQIDAVVVAPSRSGAGPMFFEVGSQLIELSLLEDASFGFVRFTKNAGGKWLPVSDYIYNLQPGNTALNADPPEEETGRLQTDREPVLHVVPNPIEDFGWIHVQLNSSERVQISLYDLQGREIKLLVDSYLESGQHRFEFSANGLGSGVYLVRMMSRTHQATESIIVSR